MSSTSRRQQQASQFAQVTSASGRVVVSIVMNEAFRISEKQGNGGFSLIPRPVYLADPGSQSLVMFHLPVAFVLTRRSGCVALLP
ncbi:MAG TPA: hypothetical protein VM011_12560, partial [Gammaproteobacteria bacterium]|nr:hypothetical protein [Gammaproteobacteria bacterium]